MNNCILKIKINDYFPKKKTIPYENYICVIICKNFYSEIKLTENKNKFFQYSFKIMNNNINELILYIKLIDFFHNCSIIGTYDLPIPFIKVNQMIKKIYSSYDQQIQLKMNPDLNLNNFDKKKNITNIYLDLIIEISSIESNISSINERNSYINFDYKENKPIREVLKLNCNKNKYIHIYNKNIPLKAKSFSKSGLFQKYKTSKNFQKDLFNDNYLDKEYLIVNNNYLNYYKTNNNNYFINDDIKNRSINNRYSKYQKIFSIENNNSKDFDEKNEIENNYSYLKTAENFYPSLDYTIKDFFLDSINQNFFKTFYNSNLLSKSNNLVENKSIDKNQHQNIINENNIINNLKKNIPFNKIINNKNYVYNKKNLLKKINSNKKINSPFNYNHNSILGKIKHLTFNKKINLSEKYENNTFNSNNNTKTHKEISNVLHYFNYVKYNKRDLSKSELFKYNSFKDSNEQNFKTISSKNQNKIKKKINEKYSPILTDIYKDIKIGDNNSLINNGIKSKIFIKKNKLKNNCEESSNIDGNKEIICPEYNQDYIKDKIIKLINDFISFTKDIKQKLKINKKLANKYFLYKEKYYSELKKYNYLKDKKIIKEIKYIIHVNINSKLNEKLYLNLKKIKNNEFMIFESIFKGNKRNLEKKKIKEKLEEQKKIHILLKITRELVKNYNNLSQIYTEENKKLLFKSLLLRYGIREKEDSIKLNLIDKFNELKLNINKEKNILDKNNEIKKEIFKEVINEEDSEEGASSLSGRKSKGNVLKKVSWCSDDSDKKKIEYLENNIHEENNSIDSSNFMSSNEKKRKEFLIEDNYEESDSLK